MIPHVDESKKDLQDEDIDYKLERTKNIKWYHYVLLNRPLKVFIALLLIAIIAPVLLYQLLFIAGISIPPSDGFSIGSCLIPREARLPCGIGNVTPELCHPQCCYDFSNKMCFHRFPSRFSYIMDRMWTEEVSLKARVSTVPFAFQNSLTNIRLSIDEVSSTHLTLSFYNSAELSLTGRRIDTKNYTYEITSPELNVMVNSSQGNILNTMRGPLIASEDIWEIAFKLTEETMYGFGEIPLRDTVKVIYSHKGGLSSIPLIFAKSNGSYHGLLIDTASPTEVSVRSDNVLLIRSITNYGFKFHVFTGPKPIDIMSDAMKLLGSKKQLEYWMLGAHICSEEASSNGTESYTVLNSFIQEAATQNVPFESHCGVTPIVFDNVCKEEEVNNVNRAAQLLRSSRKRFIPHVSPYILYERNETTLDKNETDTKIYQNCIDDIADFKDYMIHNSNSDDMYFGLVENHEVIYPNYENVSKELMGKLWTYTSDIDGVILENNWPLDESEKMVNQTYLYLPYFSKNFENAFNHTPQWNATRANGERYLYKHNQYGNHFASAFEKIGVTVPTWTTSQSMNGDIVINRQNITTSWTNLHKELIEAALGGISGHWLWSTPICGDTEDFNIDIHSSLCAKWYMAATYMPMIKIHSKATPRHPLYFNGTQRNYMVNSLKNRITLSPYFFTTLQDGPLLRPMFFQFPEVDSLKDLTSQFSVGNDLLIIPNLQPSQSLVHVWIPPGSWYELWSGLKIAGEVGQAVTMSTTEADFLTLVRGGSIVVMQKNVKLSAEETRLQSNFLLTVAMSCEIINATNEMKSNNTECTASGSLYLSSHMNITFKADDKELRITAEGDLNVLCDTSESEWANVIDEINIYGLDDELNNYDNHRHIKTDIDLCVLKSKDEIVFDLIA